MNILGTEYKLLLDDDRLNKINADGLCEAYRKVITMRNIEGMLDDEDSMQLKRLRYNETLRHEIIHAFFNEAGLAQYANDEVLVDWIARQFPKILEVFIKEDCGV